MDEYTRITYKIIVDAWHFFKTHLPVRQDDAYWDDVVHGYSEIPQRYTGTQYYDFALSVSMACADELARVAKDEAKDEAND